jgi:hypothetical protein
MRYGTTGQLMTTAADRNCTSMAAHGYPRATVDIDLLVMVDDLARVDAAVRPLGLVVPAEPMTFQGGAVEIRRVSKIHASARRH